MIESTGNRGLSDAETENNTDRWLAAVRERALANAQARPPGWSRALKIAAVSIAVLAHGLLGWWLTSLMRQHPMQEDGAIVVELIAPPAPEPELPVPPPQPERSASSTAHAPIAQSMSAPRRGDAMSATIAAPNAPPFSSATLFNPDGSITLPVPPKPTPHEAGMERGRELMQRGHNLLHCSRGRLQAYVSPEEAANAAAAGSAAYLGLFHNPSDDPLLKGIADRHESVVAGEAAAERARIKAKACDDNLWQRPMPSFARKSAQEPSEETP